ncbi:hypothetical protein [Hyalangium sp.]|uniref:hypothetical protein n=1 Tax=Hyalangium sp. TaxID=2028555 RepID=UPI002D2C7213|nr:hypothetical protein [Hyalangium sp.]HYH94707.1 hypothetical protein [Hyalangium sp.]
MQRLQRGEVLVLGMLLAAPVLAQEAKDVCGGRAGCEVQGTTRALKGHEVVELSLGKRDPQEGLECEQREWWLRRPDTSVVKLLDACNDGYGAAGLGEEDVTVGENLFRHERSGGSSWRWSSKVELQLVPLKMLSELNTSFHTASPESTETRFNYGTFEGRVVREVLDCKVSPDEADGDSATRTLEASVVPQVELPADFLKDGWKRTGLGQCSANGGAVLLGKPQGKDDARIRAVLGQGNVLFLEVVDDKWTGPSEKWLADDHVELWLFPESPEAADACGRNGKDPGLVQWGIRIADGKVFPAYGDPKPPLPVEVVREGNRARLQVKLPAGLDGLTAVYSDSDEGKKQELMVATSPVQFGRAATLSSVRILAPTVATCQVKGSELVPAPVELRPAPGEAVISL